MRRPREMQATITEYAQHRGCARNAVLYQVRRGVIFRDPATKLIDVAEADAAWPLLRERGPAAAMALRDVSPDPEVAAAIDAGDYEKLLELLLAELRE
jgi:hypothetical protein